jgi:hypothetical protein
LFVYNTSTQKVELCENKKKLELWEKNMGLTGVMLGTSKELIAEHNTTIYVTLM